MYKFNKTRFDTPDYRLEHAVSTTYPIAVPDIKNTSFIDCDGGSAHSLALDAGGNVWSWGSNSQY